MSPFPLALCMLKVPIVAHTMHTVIRMAIGIGLLLCKSLACRNGGPQHDRGFVGMSSIGRLIVREHSRLPINKKTVAFYRCK